MISSSCSIKMAVPVSLRKFAAEPRFFEDTGTWSYVDWSMKM